MPQNEKKSTLMRQWDMMRMLTVSRSDSKQDGRWDKASEIATRLNEMGYDVSVRTVQRDLLELSIIFPIELNNKNQRDYGWRWFKGANLDIPGMSVSEALAMRLVEMHLKQLLPSTMLEGLQGVFTLAQSKLDKAARLADNHSKDWLNKIRVVQPTQPLLPPTVDETVQANIYQALLENRQINVCYQSANSEHPKEYLLHPLGIIMRGSITYLVATAKHYQEAWLYALHRFSQVKILNSPVITPENFNLDHAIASGLAEFSNQKSSIKIELRCSDWLAAHLAETPLATDQTIEIESDGWFYITATVNDTWQLRWWILSQGAGVEVCAPEGLRVEVIQSVQETLNKYL